MCCLLRVVCCCLWFVALMCAVCVFVDSRSLFVVVCVRSLFAVRCSSAVVC